MTTERPRITDSISIVLTPGPVEPCASSANDAEEAHDE